MEKTKEFIRGSLRITITSPENESVDVLVAYSPEAVFAQIISALFCGNDVTIFSKFAENKV